MATDPSSSGGSLVGRTGRRVTSPIRSFINNHFEMVKGEQRTAAAGQQQALVSLTARIDELTARLSEILDAVAIMRDTAAEESLQRAWQLAAINDRLDDRLDTPTASIEP